MKILLAFLLGIGLFLVACESDITTLNDEKNVTKPEISDPVKNGSKRSLTTVSISDHEETFLAFDYVYFDGVNYNFLENDSTRTTILDTVTNILLVPAVIGVIPDSPSIYINLEKGGSKYELKYKTKIARLKPKNGCTGFCLIL
jgi:hypothetical protein